METFLPEYFPRRVITIEAVTHTNTTHVSLPSLPRLSELHREIIHLSTKMFWQDSCCEFLYISNIKCWVRDLKYIIMEHRQCFAVSMNILLHLNGRYNSSRMRLSKLRKYFLEDMNVI